MRIVIDLQGAQTESRFRGIGRYTLSLAQATARNRGDHEVIIALNGLLRGTIEPIRSAFDGILPKENIRVWYAPGPVRESLAGSNGFREAAEHIREAFLASLRPDVVHISSLFEGYLDDAVTSIGLFDQSTPTVVTLYDLIPLLNAEEYLRPNPQYESYYLRKMAYLKKAAGWLGISAFSKREAIETLGVDGDLIFNISTACDPRFRKLCVSEEKARELYQNFGLTKAFILCVGASDSRKNLPRLIRAYGLLRPDLRQAHQLLLVGKMAEGDVRALQKQAKAVGLSRDDLIFAGYASDEQLVLLLNLCKLFVFPSWHEGFGLPVLEAMSCGTPVLAANTSSLPEVLGREDSLFDPFSEEDIAIKVAAALESKSFRGQLSEHGLKQSMLFSWDESGKRALRAFEKLVRKENCIKKNFLPLKKPKLAYVSPLPPERTGIADYSAELLPALNNYYDIEVIVAQSKVSHLGITENFQVRSAEWFTEHVADYQRLLYHFGNSPFHQYMFPLLEKNPGVVCLHDFFMSNYSRYIEIVKQVNFYWCQDLYRSHGYTAVFKRFHHSDEEKVMYEYPCNFNILQSARGVIVHSNYSKQLALQWYRREWGQDWATVPLVRRPYQGDFERNCNLIGVNSNTFIVCCFGFLAPSKLNHRLLDAWLKSNLGKDSNCHLIFVGENDGGAYGQNLLEKIDKSPAKDRIYITGWVSDSEFCQYLIAADIAVQLRAFSRGETSAAVFDCMNHGIPTIVNAHGSLAELPKDAVWMLDDEFKDVSLIEALEGLWKNKMKRDLLGSRAQKIIIEQHAPEICAERYAEVIEDFYHKDALDRRNLARIVASQNNFPLDEQLWLNFASCIARNQPNQYSARNLFIDITATSRTNLKTGIERVTRALLLEMINAPPSGFRVEPIYLSDQDRYWRYYYAHRYTLDLLDCPNHWLTDEPVDFQAGDILFAPDMAGHRLIDAEKSGLYSQLRESGIGLYFMVHDLLPAHLPDRFPPGAREGFELWLACLCRIADGVVCVTSTVENDLRCWLKTHPTERASPLHIDWSHHGADLQASGATKGLAEEDISVLRQMAARRSFLMVGTIEPRKGHLQTLAAFETLWAQGIDINLIIVGQEGWKALPDSQRRTIPNIVSRISCHSEFGKHLFWLKGVSDEYLEKIYDAASCLLMASEGEGFGLPLIEAAQRGLPIIAREISVFREVAGKHAYYFNGLDPDGLASVVKKWLVLYEQRQHPRSESISWLTWAKSVEKLKTVLFKFGGDLIRMN